MKTRSLALAAMAGWVYLVVLSLPISAHAGMIRIFATNLDPWLVSWPDPVGPNDPVISFKDLTEGQHADNSDPAKALVDPVRTLNLKKTVTFKKIAPVTITFTEIATSDANVGGSNGARNRVGLANAGLNFILEHLVTNLTSRTITSFTEKLVDRDQKPMGGGFVDATVPEASGTSTHPAKVHFHTLTETEFKILKNSEPKAFQALSSEDSGQLLVYGDGALGHTKEFGFRVRVHDILESGFKRRFDLQEIPAPEPSTLSLLALATLGLIVRRRGRRAHAPAQQTRARSAAD